MADVGLDRLLGDPELERDPLVRAPPDDQLEHLALAARQPLRLRDDAARRRRAPHEPRRGASESMIASPACAARIARASSAGSTFFSR